MSLLPSILALLANISLALESPTMHPLTVSLPLHETLPLTVPSRSIEPLESRLPVTVRPDVIIATSSLSASSSKTVDALMRLNLPAGVDIEIKL